MKNLLAILTLSLLSVWSGASEQKVLVLKNKEGAAILGYDPVAYFSDGKPVKGKASIQVEHEGAIYHFASSKNKSLFEENPAKYTPAYGGYCEYAASIGRLSPISPEWFQIVDGKLILQHNKKAYDKFNTDLAGNIERANANWPRLVVRNGTGGRALLYTDRKGVALGGYDPVTYFDGGRPSRGDRKIEATFNGALYHFVSQENREIFERDPLKYAPAYGGFCGYAASIGKVRPSNPLPLGAGCRGQQSQGGCELASAGRSKGRQEESDRQSPGQVRARGGSITSTKTKLTMKRNVTLFLATLMVSASSFGGDVIAPRPTLTLEGARKVAEGAVAYARANQAPGSAIAVVDAAGYLVYFIRLDDTFLGSPHISIGKAKTAVLFKKPTSDFETLINKGRFAMTALPPDFTPLQGGVPIKHGDLVIGAIGVSGAKSAQQDEEIARAGTDAVEQVKTAAK